MMFVLLYKYIFYPDLFNIYIFTTHHVCIFVFIYIFFSLHVPLLYIICVYVCFFYLYAYIILWALDCIITLLLLLYIILL